MKKIIFASFLLMLSAPGGAQESELEALRAAAEQGQPDAQYELGILYEFGFDFPDHKPAAFAWYTRAAEQGNARAAERRDLLKAALDPAQMQRAQALLAPGVAATAAK